MLAHTRGQDITTWCAQAYVHKRHLLREPCCLQSTYTGVYSRGGPTNVDPSKELSSLLDRSDADVRGVKKRISSGSGDSSVPTMKTGQNLTPYKAGVHRKSTLRQPAQYE